MTTKAEATSAALRAPDEIEHALLAALGYIAGVSILDKEVITKLLRDTYLKRKRMNDEHESL